jgi:ribosomal protein S18 acetylase RimI-like enzyme
MSEVDVVIEQGLPEALREQAVELFEEAFGPKMRMAIREPEKRMAFLRRAYVASHVVIARDDDRLLGMAGLSTNGEPYAGGLLDVSWDPRPYRDLLGWAGAAWAVWGLRLGDHSPTADEVYIDGIAVAPEARGRGVGTRLLEEINRIAHRQGKLFVRLDVVDTNPRAQALYERLGYRVTKVQSFHWKQRWVGFGATISMEQPVAPPEPEQPVPAPATARRQP